MGGILDSGETNNTYCVGLCNVCLQDEVNIAINKGRTVNSRYPAGRDCFQGQYDQIGCRLPMSGETYSDLMSEATSSSLIPSWITEKFAEHDRVYYCTRSIHSDIGRSLA